MIWILVVTSYISNGGGMVAFQEFTERSACEAARVQVLKMDNLRNINAICVSKGKP
jgi:hypothetical protein